MNSDNPANTWSSYDSDEMCWWNASFPCVLGPGFLLPWQDAVLTAAEETGVLRVEAIEEINYIRERDGSLATFIRTHPELVPETDEWLPTGFILQQFDALPEEHTSTLLAYADQRGQVAQTWVHEMHEFAAPLGLRSTYDYQPFSITHITLDADPPETGVVHTGFYLSTDIWLPWATADSHCNPADGDTEILDNRTLGGINGERLNTFLHRVRDAAIKLGGDWDVHPRTPIFRAQVNRDGIILDGPRPGTPVEIHHRRPYQAFI
ncbi:hypothetical protein V6U90_28915 [Micromonospora sp. CPCC 206060]|uniref:hypothetical protein n=1 Tax=Micromonospora sp. CPCC 206060 TaxID=3122406 RepID=UPI002FF06302